MSERDIFLGAIDISDPTSRAGYLDRACGGDDALRGRVEALLRSHEEAGSFLNLPALASPDPGAAPTRAFGSSAADAGDGPTRTEGGGTGDETDAALAFLAPAQRPDSLGRIDHYEVLEVLGRGGFGVVFRAFDDVLQRVVAVKVLAPSMAATSPARKRFLREARSAAPIQHENVVRIHDTGEQPLPFLVMEFVAGETLQQRLDRIGPLEVTDALRIARQVAEGLAAAHEKGLIHRDIKPSNILIESGPQERAKITDFGLARAADDASLTRSGTVAGTPMYMAPEQAKGEALDPRADLFSLGSVLYAMLTGRPPFRAETTLAVLKRVAEDAARPIREIISEVPEWLCRIVEKLHAKDPTQRYQSAREVADLLVDCERQLAAHKELKDFSRIPEGEPKRARDTTAWKGLLATAIAVPVAFAATVALNAYWPLVLVLAVLLGVAVALLIPHPRAAAADAAAKAKLAPRRRGIGRKWNWAAAAAVVVFAALAALYGRAAILYVSDRGEIEVEGDSTVGVIVLRDDAPVADWSDTSFDRRIELPPGQYTLRARSRSMFYSVTGWKVIDVNNVGSRSGATTTESDPPRDLVLDVKRGRRVVVQPVTYKRPMADVERDLDKEELQGTWVAELIEFQGKLLSEEDCRQFRLVFSGDNVRLTMPGDRNVEGKFYLDATRTPREIDIHGKDGVRGVYQVTTNTLTLCIGDIGRERPPAFVRSLDPNSKQMLVTLRRLSSAEEGFGPLFNNKDLTGWRYHQDQPGEWKVENGVLVGSGQKSHLFTERGDFTDFHLRFEAKINAWGDSGVFIRAPFAIKEGWGGPLGYEAQIAARTGMLLVGEDAFGRVAGIPPDTWFKGEVIATGNRVVVKVNGEVTADYTDPSRAYPKGHLALQVWHPQTVVHFRKIEIKELPPGSPVVPPLAVAPFDAAKAKEHQEQWAKYLGTPVELENGVGMKFRLIPPGEFTMGSSAEEIKWLLENVAEYKTGPDWLQDTVRGEGPARRVTLREPFYLGTWEVTVGQFREFVKATGYKTDAEKSGGGRVWSLEKGGWEQKPEFVWDNPTLSKSDAHPVFQVTLADARAFCAWLSEKEGRRYAVPTEEQWEYACRAGTTTRWPSGDDPESVKKHGWVSFNSDGIPRPVGRLAANPFGLFDVCGNAAEITLDAQGRMVDRGGSVGDSVWRARSAKREVKVKPWDGGNSGRGFRVAIIGDLKQKSPPAAWSGPSVGERLTTFNPLGVTGWWAGKKADPVAEHGDNPAVLVFTRECGIPILPLVKQLEEEAARHAGRNLAVSFVFLTDKERVDQAALGTAGFLGLKHTRLALDAPSGPPAYRIAPDAQVTVLLCRDRTVRAVRAFRAGELNDAAVKTVVADLPLILAPIPPLTDKQRLQGVWFGESAERNGEAIPPEQVAQIRVRFDGENVRITMPGAKEELGTFKLDPDVNPKQIVCSSDADQKTRYGIYRLLDANGRLEICMTEGNERPKEFNSKGEPKGDPTRVRSTLHRMPPEKVTWRVTHAHYDGKQLPADQIKDWRVVVDGDRYTHVGFPEPQAGTFKLDVTKKIHSGVFAVDFAVTDGPHKGKTVPGIWEYYGTQMRVCTAKPGSPNRPNLFTTEPGSGGWILVLNQVPPDPVAPAAPFAILAREDKPERTFSTVAELIVAADEKDQVEVRGLPADANDAKVKQLRAELLDLHRKNAGKREAIVAAKLVSRLAWPMDSLKRDAITPEQFTSIGFKEPTKCPAEVVAVIGKSTGTRPPVVAISPDGRWLAKASLRTSGGTSKDVIVWDIEKGAVKHTLTGHQDNITGLAFSPDGKTLASCSEDTTVKLWDVGTGGEGLTLNPDWDGDLRSVAFSPDGKWLAAGCGAPPELKLAVFLWDVEKRKLEKKLDAPAGFEVSSVYFGPDGKTLAGLSTETAMLGEVGNAAIRFWEVPSGKVIDTLALKRTATSSSATRALAYSPDGKTLAAPEKEPTVKLWDTGPVREQRTLSADPEQTLFGVAFSPDGELLAATGKDHVAFWNAKTGAKGAKIALPRGAAVAFAPDGRHLVVCREDGLVVILRLKPLSGAAGS